MLKKTILALAAGAAVLAGSAPAVLAAEDGPWLVRVRATYVIPDVSSSVSAIGGEVDIDEDFIPELDISYFFTPNIAAELVLATSRHDVADNNSTLGNVELGEVSLLPPTLLLQYHFTPDQHGIDKFKPYVGAGINYTFFFDESAPRGTVESIDYENNVGYAFQLGADYEIHDNWYLNLDAKKLFLQSDVKINGGAINGDVDLDPWLVSIGVGYRFDL